MSENEDSGGAQREIPRGPATREEVMAGIRRLAYCASSENVSLRAWELMGKDIGMFRDAPDEGGAPVVRMTPSLGVEQRVEKAGRDESA